VVYFPKSIKLTKEAKKMKHEKNDMDNVRRLDSSSIIDSAVRYVMVDSPNDDDEISLLDLWLVLVMRRSLFLSIILLALLAGISIALFMTDKYTYSTALEIGGVAYDGQGRLVNIEAPSSVLAKINQGYIPLASQNYLLENPEISSAPQIKAKLEKNSSIIFIDLKGSEEYKNAYSGLLNSIVGRVKQDHKRISLLKRKDLQLSKQRVNNEITKLKNEEQLLLSQSKRLDKKAILLKKRIKETIGQLKSSEKMKESAILESRTEGKALALLMVDAELRASRGNLADLEEELQINLENKRDELLNKLVENQQFQLEKGILLEKLGVESKNLLETRALTEPMQSIAPVGVGKKLIVVISLFGGIFLALFVVFFAEFLSKAKAHKAEL
jgi:uncharacterized protein involved in exopolysaccharide biosynthesis